MSGPDVSGKLRSEELTTGPAAEHQDALGERVRSLRLPSEDRSRRSGSNMLPWILCFLLAGAAAGLGYLFGCSLWQLHRGE